MTEQRTFAAALVAVKLVFGWAMWPFAGAIFFLRDGELLAARLGSYVTLAPADRAMFANRFVKSCAPRWLVAFSSA